MNDSPALIGHGGELLAAWLPLAAERHVDPYTLWSLQTKFRQFFRDTSGTQVLDFLVELDNPLETYPANWPPPLTGGLRIVIPKIYREPMPGSTVTAKHITMRLPVELEDLAAAANAVAQLMFLPRVRRAQIGVPRQPFDREFVADGNVSSTDAQADVPAEALSTTDMPKTLAWAEEPKPSVLLGAMEDACPFAHTALLAGPGQTRVLALWDQTTKGKASGPPPSAFGYGQVRLGGALNTLLVKHSDPSGIDEHALYLDTEALQPRLRTRDSHAAAVITLMAGRGSLLPTHSTAASTLPPEPDLPPQDADDDAASRAPLVIVQFPREQIEVAGARWLMVRALDGLRFMADTSARLSTDQSPLPLVVNLSYGSIVGAHDGTALLETAMKELAKAHQKMAIVLAAGNSHGQTRVSDTIDDRQRSPSGRHAVHEALEKGANSRLHLYVPPNKPIETYLEIWFDQDDEDKEQFLKYDEISIKVTTPLGLELLVNTFPGMAFDDNTPANTCAGLLCFPRVAQSQRRSMALLVVAATQVSAKRVEVPSGIWLVEIRNKGDRTLRIQAWVERDLLPGASRRSQAARLLDCRDANDARLTDTNTFNNIATGAEVFRVGALTAIGDPAGPSVSVYSSTARSVGVGPEFSAVADESLAVPGIRVSGNTSGSVVRMNGTSVAAPQAARWLANCLADGDNMAQIRSKIASRGGGDDRRGPICL